MRYFFNRKMSLVRSFVQPHLGTSQPDLQSFADFHALLACLLASFLVLLLQKFLRQIQTMLKSNGPKYEYQKGLETLSLISSKVFLSPSLQLYAITAPAMRLRIATAPFECQRLKNLGSMISTSILRHDPFSLKVGNALFRE